MFKYLNPIFWIENHINCYWVGAAIAVGGALLSNNEKNKGVDSQVDAAQQGIDEINKIGERTRQDTQPYRDLGGASASKLSYLLGLTPKNGGAFPGSEPDMYTLDDWKAATNKSYAADGLSPKMADYWAEQAYNRYKSDPTWQDNPGAQGTNTVTRLSDIRKLNTASGPLDTSDGQYGSLTRKFNQEDLDSDLVYQNGLQFGLDNGNKAIENRARALGGSDSGSALKALTKFGNDYGTTKTEGAYNRNTQEKSNIYNMLMGGTGVGENAVKTDAATGQNLATALAGQYNAQGNAKAAGNSNNADTIGTIASIAGSFF